MKISPTKDYKLLARQNEEVQNLHAKLYPELFKPHNLEENEAYYKEAVKKDQNRFYILEDEGEVRGFIGFEIAEPRESAISKAYGAIHVNQINVKKEYHSRGYGRKLMEQVYKTASKEKIDFIKLNWWTGNEDAANFYAKQGFKIIQSVGLKKL